MYRRAFTEKFWIGDDEDVITSQGHLNARGGPDRNGGFVHHDRTGTQGGGDGGRGIDDVGNVSFSPVSLWRGDTQKDHVGGGGGLRRVVGKGQETRGDSLS